MEYVSIVYDIYIALLDTSSLHQALLICTCQGPYKVGIPPCGVLKDKERVGMVAEVAPEPFHVPLL